jgi:integrase
LKRQAEEQPAMGAPLTSSKGEVVRQGSGRPPRAPFEPSTLRRRALAVWKPAGLAPTGLHECRHTFASLMIASGVNAEALCSYMGHASVAITFDTNGKPNAGQRGRGGGPA